MSSDLRNKIRAAVSSAKPRSVIVSFNGVEIEMRQPSLGEVMDGQQTISEDRKEGVARMMIRFAYVPGTEEKVFEEGDVDMLIGLPFGDDMQRMNEAINNLTGVEVTDATKSGTPEESPAVGHDDSGGDSSSATVGDQDVADVGTTTLEDIPGS